MAGQPDGGGGGGDDMVVLGRVGGSADDWQRRGRRLQRGLSQQEQVLDVWLLVNGQDSILLMIAGVEGQQAHFGLLPRHDLSWHLVSITVGGGSV